VSTEHYRRHNRKIDADVVVPRGDGARFAAPCGTFFAAPSKVPQIKNEAAFDRGPLIFRVQAAGV